MRNTVTWLGDCFLYCMIFFTAITIIGIVFTDAKYFLLEEFNRNSDPKGQIRAIEVFRQKIKNAGLSSDSFSPTILIRKRNRELLVLSEDTIVASYPVGLGRATIGIKLNGKDQKTPEGQYYVCDKDDNHHFHLFLKINYPSPDDAKRGSVQQIVKPSEEELIVKAWEAGTCPPLNTALGGPLGLHGFGAESSWTKDGSISLHNIHMEELFWNIPKGTPVAIIP